MNNFRVTKREILVCVSIVAILLAVGFLIGGQISDHFADENETYNKAVKLEDPELFQYGMRTNVGPAFVYGELSAISPVTYPEISGEYMYIEKVKEEYRTHTRVVTDTRVVNGKTQTYTRTETYQSWDRVSSDDIKCDTLLFCGAEFDSDKIDIPSSEYIDTVKVSSKVRYKFYGTAANYTGTIFTELGNETISDNTPFYVDKNIEATVEQLENSGTGALVAFWIFWVILIVGCCFAFCYIDNRWLE